MSDRDPRVDPKAGDVLASDMTTVEILAVEDGRITYRWPGKNLHAKSAPLVDFFGWAKSAKVIHVER